MGGVRLTQCEVSRVSEIPSQTTVPRKWEPKWYQLPMWHAMERGTTRALVIAHRRWGKDDVALNWMAGAAMRKVATYWYLLPMQRQARRVIWEAINPHTGMRRIDEAFPREIRRAVNNTEMSITLSNGSMVHLAGSDNYDSLVGSPPYGVVFSEWALAKPAAWGFVRPILKENGGWSMFLTTPRGKNHAYKMLRAAQKRPELWHVTTQSALDTDVYTDQGLLSEREEYLDEFGIEDGTALFEQEYLCSFEAAIRGSYWGPEVLRAEREGRVVENLPVIPGLPVHRSWDIGVDDQTAIWWFQITDGGLRYLHYYEQSGMGVDHFAEEIRRVGDARGFSYSGAIDFVPHDAKQRSWTSTNKDGTARQRLEDMKSSGLNPQLVPNHSLSDGINAARKTIQRAMFDGRHCEEGLECLRNYQRLWDMDNRIYSQTPFRNWAIHGADSFRYSAMGWTDYQKPEPKPKGKHIVMAQPDGTMRTQLTFEQLRDRRTLKRIQTTGKSFNEMRDLNARKRKRAKAG